MLARVLQQSPPMFGMVGYHDSVRNREKRKNQHGYVETGTMLEVISVQMTADGRSVVELTGRWRFEVERATVHADGYLTGDLRRVDDVSTPEEEDIEATERARYEYLLDELLAPDSPNSTTHEEDDSDEDGTETPEKHSSKASPISSLPSASVVDPLGQRSQTLPDPPPIEVLPALSTIALYEICTSFIKQMQTASASWLHRNVLASVGPMPENDPALFTWWFVSVMPVIESEKYHLLTMRSVRERLRLCAEWVITARRASTSAGVLRPGALGRGDMCATM
jgi:hypothetical protein